MIYSTALTGEANDIAVRHLLRVDRQEDLCFALYRPSVGRHRRSALITKVLLPMEGERNIHGNTSFNPQYFDRVVELALQEEMGIAFMHSHIGPGWQDMSPDDIRAEKGRAAACVAATGLPLVGLTLGTDGAWSARFWEKTAPRVYERFWCQTVRVIGDIGFGVTFADHLLPAPGYRARLDRTISAWGTKKQQELARLKIGVVGVGSVGSIIAEALARIGVGSIKLLDFDVVEEHNLDRLLNVGEKDIGKFKVEVLARELKKSGTAKYFNVKALPLSVVEEAGFREALDCDILFSCVDRPWPRSVLNTIAYAHLIPVVDGGILVKTKADGTVLGADWKAHAVMVGRRCLECLGQYSPGLVQTERNGDMDDPEYIESLNVDHPLKQNQNVFAFSLSVASLEILQMLSLVIAPYGISNVGEYNHHFVTGSLDIEYDKQCLESCPYPGMIGLGDRLPYQITGRHQTAEDSRNRVRRQPRWYRLVMHLFVGH